MDESLIGQIFSEYTYLRRIRQLADDVALANANAGGNMIFEYDTIET